MLGRHAMEEDARVVRLFSSERQRNHIQTNKYTWYNFLPKNLLEQFSQSGNLYFLMVAVGQLIPSISNTQGKPATLLPLSAVVSMQAVKDLFEDSARVQSDKVENNRTVTWLHPAASCCMFSKPRRLKPLLESLRWKTMKTCKNVKDIAKSVAKCVSKRVSSHLRPSWSTAA